MTSPTEPEQERPLRGGRLTPGVVRIGDTVRRPAGPASDDVAALLRHLDDAGFAGAPRHLGRDERGRDVLTHIDGWVPARFQSFDDAQVRAAGALLRGFHAATRAFARARAGTAADVICHHDPGPNNVVFRNGEPVALIDFDLAAPGDALDDVAYMAWTWCVSSRPARGPAARQAAQVRLLADAYGLDAAARHRLVDAMLDRQARNAAFWSAHGADAAAVSVVTPAQVAERVAWSMRERDYTIAHRAAFEAALR